MFGSQIISSMLSEMRSAIFAIRHYILSNPQRWEMDAENPNGNGTDKFEAWVEQLNDPLTAGVES